MPYGEEHEEAMAAQAAEEKLKLQESASAAAIAENDNKISEEHDLEVLVATKAVTILNIAPARDGAIQSLYRESLTLRVVAESRQIKTADDMKLATDDAALISKLKKALEEQRKKYVNPIRENLDAVNATFKEFTAPLDGADRINREKMGAFNKEQERIRQAQEHINQLRNEAAQREAALTGGEISEPVNEVEVIPEVKKTTTNLGTSGMRDNWVYEIVDFAALPDDYKLPNTAALNALAKSIKDTRNIPGLRIFNSQVVVVRPR